MKMHLAPVLCLLATLSGCAVQPGDELGESAQALTGAPSTASATNVAITGNAYVGSRIVGGYTLVDSAGGHDCGSIWNWRRTCTVGANSVTDFITADSTESYTLTGAETNCTMAFCVTPSSDGSTYGSTVCSSAVLVPGIIWYTGASQTGTATPEVSTNGACVNMSSLGLTGLANSLRLDGQASGITTLVMYRGANCSGVAYSRSAGANGAHSIDLATVGIGANTVSYRVSW